LKAFASWPQKLYLKYTKITACQPYAFTEGGCTLGLF
jgi:hypothetical protein